jgi:hypothetical protein
MPPLTYQNLLTRPPYQAVAIYTLVCLLLLSIKAANLFVPSLAQPDTYWLVHTAFLLIYIVISAIGSLLAPRVDLYWQQAFLTTTAYILLSSLTTFLISGKWMKEIDTYYWLHILLSVAYLVFMSICRLIRVLIAWLQLEDEQGRK